MTTGFVLPSARSPAAASLLSFLARAAPPSFPPSRPSSTAAGSFLRTSSPSAVASSGVEAARTFTSRGRFLLDRFGIAQHQHSHARHVDRGNVI